MNAAPLALYVHWPFCAAKCPYCDFNSHVRGGGIDEARFLAAYLRELEHAATQAARAPRRPLTSIFFGGGTPSLMRPQTVGAILDAAAGHWGISADAEITLEANPTSVEAGRFAGYRSAGVNRVSLGVQALRDADLKSLGRLHTVAEAKRAIAIARENFERVSFDLIYARPGQTLPRWRAELAEALDMGPGHLSLYQLTIEPETPFAALHLAGKLTIPAEEPASDLFALTQEMTIAAGLPAYEVSNHARPGRESRHNLLYWRYGEYIGVGAGAHGRLSVDGARVATVTEKSPEAWLARVEAHGHGQVEATRLTPAEMADEMLVMGLRTGEGLDLGVMAALTGRVPAPAEIAALADLGMATLAGNRLRTTAAGRPVLNAIVTRLATRLVAAGPVPDRERGTRWRGDRTE